MELMCGYIRDISNFMRGQIRNIEPNMTNIDIRVMVPNSYGVKNPSSSSLHTHH